MGSHPMTKWQSKLEQQTSASRIHVLVLTREKICLKTCQQIVFQSNLTISSAWSSSFSMDPYGFSSPSLISLLHHIECQQWRWGSQLSPRSILAAVPQDCGIHHSLWQSQTGLWIQAQSDMGLASCDPLWLQLFLCTHVFLENQGRRQISPTTKC